jgi:hypothetical protein
MGRARRVSAGTRNGGLAVEYVRSRRVVRLLGWLHNEAIEPVEIPIEELCKGLGIEPGDVGAPHHYLLFSGSHRRPLGGLRDLGRTFDSEEEAWTAFRELRQNPPYPQGWAELAAIDGSGHVNQLAWFGLQPEAGAPDDTPAPPAETTKDVKPPVRRLVASGDVPPYLHAVTPS